MADLITRLLLDTRGFSRNLQQTKKDIGGFKKSMESIGKIAGPLAAFAGVSVALGDIVNNSIEFEKSLSSLRSLTGVTTDELRFFKEEAIRLGSTTTQTASQVVDAFKLIGSQMPELLKSKEALTQVTESAIVLAEAAEIDVPAAAKALTGALNQMGKSSYHATDYINILAAASQQGSADIPYLNKAIEKAGGTANAVGIEFNELVAAIEAVAPKISEASEAGTNLRNIFLILEGSADQKLKPSIVGLGTALDNLAAKQMDATQLTKMFGRESVTSAMALLSQRDAYHQLKEGITGTNTAFEQQKINNDNLAGSIKGLQSAWEGFTLSINNSNGVLKSTVDLLTKGINGARELLDRGERPGDSKRQKALKEESSKVLKMSGNRIKANMAGGMTRKEALNWEEDMAYLAYGKADQVDALRKAMIAAEEAHQKSLKTDTSVVNLEKAKQVTLARKAYQEAEREAVLRKAILDSVAAQRAEMEKITATPTPTPTTPLVPGTPKASSPEGSIAALDAKIKQAQVEYANAAGDAARTAALKTLKELQGQRVRIEFIAKYGNVKSSDMKGKGGLAALAGKPEGWDKIEAPFGKKDVKANTDFADSMMHVADSFGMLGEAAQNMGNNALAGMMSSMGAVAQMIVQLHGLTTANGVASAAKLPFPANLAAIATVVSTVATVFSSLPKFADGGIVGGSSVFGDKLLARVNSGEMILNKSQQGRLLSLADGGGGVSHVSVDGEAKVKGEAIYIALNNYVKRTGKKNIW